jgi:hypothetical protein
MYILRKVRFYIVKTIQKLPNKDIQHYSEQEKIDALDKLANIGSRSAQFLSNTEVEKRSSSKKFDEAEEKIFKRFTDMLELIMYHSNSYYFQSRPT